MLRFIMSRGPDDSGVYRQDIAGHSAAILHSRLSIIDLTERAKQPMLDSGSDWVISYNGEIFNYLELRQELIALGHSFCSDSDTEVLLKAWVEWGQDALPRLNGMFAFCVFNRQTGQAWLVRDRYGVKPLLWGRTEAGVVFSSSVAGVAASINASVDIDYCARGLRYKTFELPESGAPFLQVQSVPPGSWVKMEISARGVDITDGCWYDLKEAVSARRARMESSTDEQLLEECRHILEDSVRLRLRSDVPLAVSLSGGLDSSTVSALASRHVSNLCGFTYGSSDAVSSEGPIVAAFSQSTGINAQFVWPEYGADELDDLLERTFAFQEAPFGGLSVLAQNEVFREVRLKGFKVLLGGQGGDEAFAGYRKFFVVALRDALNRHDPLSAIRYMWSLGLMLLHEVGQAQLYWRGLNRYTDPGSFQFKLIDWHPQSINLWGQGSSLESRQIEDVQRWSIPSLLRYEDRNSMGHGLETRLPFMDYRLMEFALALPARLKIAKGFGKWALRRVGQGMVPDFIRLNRKKRGFDVTQSWVKCGIGASLRRRILDNKSALSGYLKPNIDQLLSDTALVEDSRLVDEALMLAWLTEPVREQARWRVGE